MQGWATYGRCTAPRAAGWHQTGPSLQEIPCQPSARGPCWARQQMTLLCSRSSSSMQTSSRCSCQKLAASLLLCTSPPAFPQAVVPTEQGKHNPAQALHDGGVSSARGRLEDGPIRFSDEGDEATAQLAGAAEGSLAAPIFDSKKRNTIAIPRADLGPKWGATEVGRLQHLTWVPPWQDGTNVA